MGAEEAHGKEGPGCALLVQMAHNLLLEAMHIPEQTVPEQLLGPRISGLFDISRMARISLGRTWRTLDAAERDEFRTLLAELIVATYADRFDSFNEQMFVTDSTTTGENAVVVRTRLVRRNEESVNLDYYLRGGRVFNVVADGVSDLSLRRADYNSIIKREGYPALLLHLQEDRVVAFLGDAKHAMAASMRVVK